MKKLMKLVMAFMLMIMPFSSAIVKAEAVGSTISDTTKPVLEQVEIVTTTIEPGQRATVRVKASDEGSGIDSISGSLRHTETGKTIYLSLTSLLSQDGWYTLQSNALEKYVSAGTWTIDHVHISDEAENFEYVYGDVAEFGTLEIINEQADSIKPVLEQVEIVTTTVQPGQRATIRVKASDEGSGIDSISGSLRHTETGKTIYLSLTSLLSQDGWYTLQSSSLEKYVSVGTWTIDHVHISDEAENSESVYGDTEENAWGSIEVISTPFENIQPSETTDTTAPIIESIEVLTPIVKSGGRAQFKVKATDDISGISSISMTFTNPSNTHSVTGYIAEYLADGSYLVETSNLNVYGESGDWYLSYMYAYDEAGNSMSNSSNRDENITTFNYDNDMQSDTAAPEIENIEVLTPVVKSGGRAQFKVKATDDISGISSVSMTFTNPSNTHSVTGYIVEYLADGSYLVETSNLSMYGESGDWYLSYMYAYDEAGNSMSNSSNQDESMAKFTYENDLKGDMEAPKIESIEVLTPVVKSGGRAQFKVKAADDISGISSISMTFTNPSNTHSVTGYIAEYLADGSYLVETSNLNVYGESGDWYLSYMYAYDEAGNSTSTSYSDHSKSAATFAYKVATEDVEGPIIFSTAMNSMAILPGESAEFTVTTYDKKADIAAIHAVFESPSTNQNVVANLTVTKQADDSTYTVKTNKLSDSAEAGMWYIKSLYVEDTNGNVTEQTYGLDGGIALYPNLMFEVAMTEKNDVNAPIISSANIASSTYYTGDNVQLNMQVTDSETVVSKVYAEFTSMTGAKLRATLLSNDGQNGSYKLEAKLSPFADVGTWYVSKLYAEDVMGNYVEQDYSIDTTIAAFEVYEKVEDKTPPAASYTYMETSNVMQGNKAVLNLHASDESTIKHVAAEYTSVLTGETIRSEHANNDGNGSFTVETKPLSPYAATGQWYVSKLFMEDTVGNYIEHTYTAETTLASFYVEGKNEDQQPPTIHGVDDLSATVQVGSTYEFEVMAEDVSGIKKIYTVFQSPSGTQKVKANQAFDTPQHSYITSMFTEKFSPFAETGQWFLQYLYVEDAYGNYVEHTYTAENTPANVTVQGKQVDYEAPNVTNVLAPEKSVQLGEQVPLQVTASDDGSGVSHVQMKLTSPSGAHTVETTAEVENIGDNTYALLTKRLNLFAETGEWYVSYVYVSDKADNYREYTYIAKDAPATVNVTTALTEAPPSDDIVFEQWEAQQNVARDKEWTIDFSLNVDIATILTNNIYITNAQGQKIGARFIIDRQANGQASSITIAPLDRYEAQATYTLWIKDVMSTDGQKLTKNEKMLFTTTK